MRVLVCGSRGATHERDFENVFVYLDDCYEVIDEFIYGKCPASPDMFVESTEEREGLAELFRAKAVPYPANWENEGKAAGFNRNTKMIEEGDPDLVVAVWDGASNGTWDTIAKAIKYHIPIHIIPATHLTYAARMGLS